MAYTTIENIEDVWGMFGSESSSSSLDDQTANDRNPTGSSVVVSQDFEVFDSHGLLSSRGKGLRSLKKFSVGDEILREQATIRVLNCHAATSQQQANALHRESVRRAYDDLSERSQRNVLELSTCAKNAERFLSSTVDKNEALDARLQGIFHTNSYRLSEEGGQQSMGGLFLTVARINHSCRPNASHCWRPDLDCFLLFATREIEVGDEVYLSYLPDDSCCRTTKERREFLRNRFSFHCSCEMCIEGNSGGGDDRMTELARLHDLLPELVSMERYRDAIETVEQSLRLLHEQKLGFGVFTKTLLGYGYQISMEDEVAHMYLEQQLIAVTQSEGLGCPNAIRIQRLLEYHSDITA